MERWKKVWRQQELYENMQVEIEKKIVISLSEFVKEHEDLEESLEGKF